MWEKKEWLMGWAVQDSHWDTDFSLFISNEFAIFFQAQSGVGMLFFLLMSCSTLIYKLVKYFLSIFLPASFLFLFWFGFFLPYKSNTSALKNISYKHFTFDTSLQDMQQN